MLSDWFQIPQQASDAARCPTAAFSLHFFPGQKPQSEKPHHLRCVPGLPLEVLPPAPPSPSPHSHKCFLSQASGCPGSPPGHTELEEFSCRRAALKLAYLCIPDRSVYSAHRLYWILWDGLAKVQPGEESLTRSAHPLHAAELPGRWRAGVDPRGSGRKETRLHAGESLFQLPSPPPPTNNKELVQSKGEKHSRPILGSQRISAPTSAHLTPLQPPCQKQRQL